ncbi:MAG: 4-hydroxy-3-methylbut-2-enyl diphosphate reductase, partial [Clostridia bacterium]|nr:4-hydroxy-3-methylbut-2-enyl diphosphate reductase [Clostridia bacterium]
MPITVAKHAGFCMGVRRAVDGAVKAAQEGKKIVSFGELAHNPEVIEHLSSIGVSVIHHPEDAKGRVVLIRSHGVSPVVTHKLRSLAEEVIDLTCPFVSRLHDFVDRYSADGSPVILVGQSDHPEVVGTIGCAHGPVYTVHDVDEAQSLPVMPRALAVSQTTFPHERWEAILPVL